VYPLIYRPLIGKSQNPRRILFASLVAAITALQLGAFSVVLETLLSGKSELPFGAFLLLMQPIHLAIGMVEGAVTAGIVNYVYRVRPEILESMADLRPLDSSVSMRKIMVTFVVLAMMTGAVFSWFASTHPDGLEWSIEKITGQGELREAEHGIVPLLKRIQEKTAFLPDYNFRSPEPDENAPAWPAIDGGTSAAGLIGGAIVLGAVALIGAGIRFLRRGNPVDGSSNR